MKEVLSKSVLAGVYEWPPISVLNTSKKQKSKGLLIHKFSKNSFIWA